MKKKILSTLLCLCLLLQVQPVCASSVSDMLTKAGKITIAIGLLGQVASMLGIGAKKSPEQKKKDQEKKDQKALDKAYAGDNLEKVMQWAEKDDPQAQCILAYAYLTGQGVAKDRAQALAWQDKAAAQNALLVKNFIPPEYYDQKKIKLPRLYALAGRRSHLGQYVKQSYDDAVRWSALGAKQKDTAALAYMGSAYYTGRGVPQDYKKAVACLEAAGKEPLALQMMSMAFRDGKGVDKDLDKSQQYSDYLRLVQQKKDQQKKDKVLKKYDKQIKDGDLYGIVR